MKMIATVLLTLGVLMSSVAHADPAPLTQDTYVAGYGSEVNKTKGAQSTLKVAGGGPRRSYVQFNLSGIGGTVTSAMLTFNVQGVNTGGSVALHVVQGAWNENTLTFNTQPVFDPSAAASVLVTAIGSVSLDITAIAQAWVDSPGSNRGLALLTGASVFFWSKEAGLGATLDVVSASAPAGNGAVRVLDSNDLQVGGKVLSFSTKTIFSPPSQHQIVQVVYESDRGPIVLTVRTDGFDDTGGLRFLLADCDGTPLVFDSGGFTIPNSDLFVRDDVVVVGTSIWIQDGPGTFIVGGTLSGRDSTGNCINNPNGNRDYLEMVFAGDLSQFQPPFRLDPLP